MFASEIRLKDVNEVNNERRENLISKMREKRGVRGVKFYIRIFTSTVGVVSVCFPVCRYTIISKLARVNFKTRTFLFLLVFR